MLACLLLLSAHLLGLLVACKLELPLRAFGRVGFGLALGQGVLLWLPYLLAVAFDLDARTAGAAASAVCVPSALVLGLAQRRRGVLARRFGELTQALRAPGAGVAFACTGSLALLFAWLLHTHFLLPQADGLYSAGVTWGDLPMHLALATRFMYAEGLAPLEHPLYLHGPLAYPFLPDYAVAVLAQAGLPLRAAFITAGLLPFIALLLLVRALAHLWLDGDDLARSRAASLTQLLFAFTGGLGFVWFARDVYAGGSPTALLAGTNYTYLQDDTILKANPIGNLFVAARTATPGMAIGIAALWLLGHVRLASSPRARDLLLAGVLMASLPWIHSHSFLVVCGAWLAYALLRARPDPRWLWALAPLVVLALPQLVILQRMASGKSFVRPVFGFLRAADGVGQWSMDVVLGIGVPLLLLPSALWAAGPRARRLATPLLLLLPVACVVTFTPTVYDNVKLVAWFDLAAAMLCAGLLGRGLARRSQLPWVAVVVLGCTLSGGLAVAHELLNRARVVTHDDVRLADLVREHTPVSAIVATASSGHDPVAMLSGRRTLLAAPYMLSTHGIDVRPRAHDVVRLYAGGPAAREVVERLGVTAVLVGPRERADLPVVNEAWLARHAVAQHGVAGRTLYLLR